MNDLGVENEQVALERLGAELKQLYFTVASSGIVEADLSVFESCVVEAVEEVAKHSADELTESYHELRLPIRDGTPRVADSFIAKIIGHFHDALCTELYESRDLSTNTRDLIVVLAPTIITPMNLPLPYAALAIPISVILSKVGLKSLCQEYEVRKQTKEFAEHRLEIHRRNLLFLEQERSRYPYGSVPDILETAIFREELKIQHLQEQVRSLQG